MYLVYRIAQPSIESADVALRFNREIFLSELLWLDIRTFHLRVIQDV
jgi:hypothetical protein